MKHPFANRNRDQFRSCYTQRHGQKSESGSSVTFAASITHGGWNFPLTVNGTGFVPGASVTWNGTALTHRLRQPHAA